MRAPLHDILNPDVHHLQAGALCMSGRKRHGPDSRPRLRRRRRGAGIARACARLAPDAAGGMEGELDVLADFEAAEIPLLVVDDALVNGPRLRAVHEFAARRTRKTCGRRVSDLVARILACCKIAFLPHCLRVARASARASGPTRHRCRLECSNNGEGESAPEKDAVLELLEEVHGLDVDRQALGILDVQERKSQYCHLALGHSLPVSRGREETTAPVEHCRCMSA